MNTNNTVEEWFVQLKACYLLRYAGIITDEQLEAGTQWLTDINRLLNGVKPSVPDTQPTPVSTQPTVTVTRRRFTDDDNATLLRLYARGWTTARIADELGRTHATIVQKVKRLQQQGVLPRRYRPRKDSSNTNNTQKAGK